MARTVRDTTLATRTARARLKNGKKHWRALDNGRHLGYRRNRDSGTWFARYKTPEGRYVERRIGIADDTADADGLAILNCSAAQARARDWFAEQERREAGGHIPASRYTVRDAVEDYLSWFAIHRRSLRNTRLAIEVHVLPTLGRVEVAKLTAQKIRVWHERLASTPPRVRSRRGEAPKYREMRKDPDAARSRKATANRVLSYFKAALNYAFAEGKVSNDQAWRRVRPFRSVEATRQRYLTRDECVRLINACSPDLRLLVQAALFTGCRYGELTALNIEDFNPDSRTIQIRASKSGRPRHVVLPDGQAEDFFTRLTAGRKKQEPLLTTARGRRWQKSDQQRPLLAACAAASIDPPISFHILRHTHASHLAMNAAPLGVIAHQLGHSDTRMVERHYAHLAPNYVADTIRAAFPDLGIFEADNVTVLPRRS